MPQHRRLRSAAVTCSAAALFLTPGVGCGESEDDDGSNGSGVVTEPFDQECTITFLEDTAVIDVFDDVVFTARSGETYLLGDELFDDGNTATTTFLYTTQSGAVDFDAELQSDAYETNCPTGTATASYVGVFTDVEGYADAALTDKVCDLPRGTMLSVSGFGFIAEGEAYLIQIAELVDACGTDEIYVQAAQINIGGGGYIVPPLAAFIGPA